MGAYLSEPRTEKVSSDEFNEKLVCGASSMQGWRVSQEDAHNCIIDFDTNTSLFAVYDGHGGHEVAVYCSQKLPEFIKNTDAYKKDDMKQALIDAYLGFDATIATREVVAILKEIAGDKKNEDGVENSVSSDDEENVDNLYEEAHMPLDKLMEKYQCLQNESKKIPLSPNLHPRDGPSCSSSSRGNFGSASSRKISSSDEPGKSIPGTSDEKQDVSGSNRDNIESKSFEEESSTIIKKDADLNIEENGKKSFEAEINGEVSASQPLENGQYSENSNMHVDDSVEKIKKDENIKDEVKSTGDEKEIDSDVKKADGKANTNRPKFKPCTIRQLYSAILATEECDDADSEDENDKTFDGGIEEDSNEEEHEEESDDDDDDSVSVVDEESEGDEDEEDEEDEDDFTMNMTEEPGSDSGCTAVVAILRGNELYVANAGDSRCVVCRDGKAVEMSIDHKPETKEESNRITAAGGRVTGDGRVNGGLNLSRAIGDHAYKQAVDLPAEQQMITALPDVATLTIDSEHDEFMVLACDGIWNYMSSEQVIQFVGERLKKTQDNLSRICEEMFDHCLAPNTMGDGTGCDNMTAIIVHFKNGQTGSAKRSASPIRNENEDTKRVKTDDLNETVVT